MVAELVGGLALILLSAVLIGYPLIVGAEGGQEDAAGANAPATRGGGAEGATEAGSEAAEAAEEERERVLAALDDVEFDYKMNKMSEEDYRGLRAELARQADRLEAEKRHDG